MKCNDDMEYSKHSEINDIESIVNTEVMLNTNGFRWRMNFPQDFIYKTHVFLNMVIFQTIYVNLMYMLIDQNFNET